MSDRAGTAQILDEQLRDDGIARWIAAAYVRQHAPAMRFAFTAA
jgi:hypothetical protein